MPVDSSTPRASNVQLLVVAVVVTAVVSCVIGYRLGFNDALEAHAADIRAIVSHGG